MPTLRVPVIAAMFAGLALAGCASTPTTRIKDRPDLYAQLTTAQRAQVLRGEIALGMPEGAVTLALGQPDSVTERTDAKGVAHIWHYYDRQSSVTVVNYVGFYDPLFFPFPFPDVVVTTPGVQRDRIRAYIVDGKVSAFEREESPQPPGR